MDFVAKRKVLFAVSSAVILVGLFFLIFSGLNRGIDFAGGVLLQLRFARQVTAPDVRAALASPELADIDLGTVFVQMAEDEVMLRVRPVTDHEMVRIREQLEVELGSYEALGIHEVHPVVGGELFRSAIIAFIIATLLVVLYVSIRFEYRFGVSAIVALVHDVLVVLGIYAILRVEVNMPFVAAILTVIGYSINDSIVIFDRIRENVEFRKRGESLADVVNKSLNQTIVRSLNTSGTTFLVVLSLHILGAPVIREFSLALLIGVIVGTYSSIFVASQVWLAWRETEQRQRQREVGA